MCLILLAVEMHPEHALVLAANRDEAHVRPTAKAAYWTDAPRIFGGRDLSRGGTWLGVTRAGRFAALTNVRDPKARTAGRSRGLLVKSVLENSGTLPEVCEKALALAGEYPSFNLIVGEQSRVFYLREDATEPLWLGRGVYGLSNARIDESWPKVERGKQALATAVSTGGSIDHAKLFDMLRDGTLASDTDLPQTGIPRDVERMLSSPFIVSPAYGTRCSTVLFGNRDGTFEMEEHSFDAAGGLTSVVRETIR